MDEPKEYIDFMARYRDWIAIKRIGIREGTDPKEVSLYLATVKETIEPKFYKFLEIDMQALDELADSMTKGMKKGYDSLAAVLPRMNDKSVKESILKACKDPKTKPMAESYLFGRILSDLEIEAFTTPKTFVKMFPEYKISKKGMGRGAKGVQGL
ncbi:MAG: DUF2666 family protein [Candidatus Micrarchaeia archaeon]